MAYLIGQAKSTTDFYLRLKNFILGKGFHGRATFSGTGNGKMIDFRCLDLANADEVYTVVCETAEHLGGGFDTISSLRGNLFDTLVNQVYNDPRVQYYLDFGSTDFTAGDTFTLKFCDYAGVSKGRFTLVDPGVEAKTEVITLTCTAAGQHEIPSTQPWLPAEFSVSGSVSGAMASYSQGTLFSNSIIAFTLDSGTKTESAAVYEVGDVVRIYTTRNPLREANQHWETLRQYQDVNGNDTEWIFKGKGNAGTDEIFLHINRSGSNLTLGGMRGYSPGLTINEQPGALLNRPYLPMYVTADGMPYWISVTGRRINIKLRNNTYYHDAYMGLGIPWGSPRYQPYFLCVGACRASALSVGIDNSNYWNAQTSQSGGSGYFNLSPMQVMNRSGVWQGHVAGENGSYDSATSGENVVYPYYQQNIASVGRNLDGSHPLLPISMYPDQGDLDGVFAVPSLGYGSLPEDIIWNPTNGKKYIVTPDTYKSTPFQAMELI